MPRIPDLTFPMVEYGAHETPWSLESLLFKAAPRRHRHAAPIALRTSKRELGERLPLAIKFHESICGRLVAGASRHTAKKHIVVLKRFYAWMDANDLIPSMDLVAMHYVAWTDHLLHRVTVSKSLSARAALEDASTVGAQLADVLDQRVSLLRLTRIRKLSKVRSPFSTGTKENLDNSFQAGRALLDIANALTADVVFGTLPVQIQFRSGALVEEWSGLIPADRVKCLDPSTRRPAVRNGVLAARAAWESDKTKRTRYPLLNLRIESEMLIFIAQTGMNLAQAVRLEHGNFTYRSHLDGYEVRRVFKGRRQGEVEFQIFSEYRLHFERYLSWLKAAYPTPPARLFPQSSPVTRSPDVALTFRSARRVFTKLGITFVGPRQLRKTRVNWLLRNLGDRSIAAEMSQHSLQTQLRSYDHPDHQIAASEISQFLAAGEYWAASPGPGICVNATPEAIPIKPNLAPDPDCISPAGCLFCANHRDIDSFDHIWSLATYRFYKAIEVGLYRTANSEGIPAHAVVERASAKLHDIGSSSVERADWLREANARLTEGNFHPRWAGFIGICEATVG